MNRSVPTLLGIMIILMVVMLVVLIYDYRVTSGLAAGGTVVGTVGGQLLTGVDQPTVQVNPSASVGRAGKKAAHFDPAAMRKSHGRLPQASEARGRMQQRMASGRGPKEHDKIPGPGPSARRTERGPKTSDPAD